jgi:chemotaxis protein CheZ
MDVHHKIGHLTRQLHNTLNELGLADKLKDTVGELPDVKSRLHYIARLTGDAAEKVLNQVDQAKVHQELIARETSLVKAALKKDPVSAVAKGQVMNYLSDIEVANQGIDSHLTAIMMAQDFHDLTGQVIAKVVHLATSIEEQLVELLIQTAPKQALVKPVAAEAEYTPALAGPVTDTAPSAEVVTNQSEVDDLLASLGF